VPVEPENRRGEVRAQHATTHPDGGIWHLISLYLSRFFKTA
jgi:hypothetical protein